MINFILYTYGSTFTLLRFIPFLESIKFDATARVESRLYLVVRQDWDGDCDCARVGLGALPR